jgi:hypothetical protein
MVGGLGNWKSRVQSLVGYLNRWNAGGLVPFFSWFYTCLLGIVLRQWSMRWMILLLIGYYWEIRLKLIIWVNGNDWPSKKYSLSWFTIIRLDVFNRMSAHWYMKPRGHDYLHFSCPWVNGVIMIGNHETENYF